MARISANCSKLLAAALALATLAACEALRDEQTYAPGNDAGVIVLTPGRPHAGGSGAFGGAGVGGFMGTAGGFGPGICGVDLFCPMPPVPIDPACFECAVGCFDCGMGCFCDDAPPTPPPPWTPPFVDVGEDGWRQSDVALCGGLEEVIAVDLFADDEGVHVVVSGHGVDARGLADEDAGVATGDFTAEGAPPVGLRDAGIGAFDFLPRTRVLRNAGTGWARRAELPGASVRVLLQGLGAGALALASSNEGEAVVCPLGVIRDGSLDCSDTDPIDDIVRVSDSRSYALMLGTRLLEWDGTRWRGAPSLLPYPARVLWADQNEVLAFGSAGTILRKTSVGWDLVPIDSFETITAVWGESPDDLWLGTSDAAVLHFDGEKVEERFRLGGTTCSAAPPVRGLFGSGDTLYAHTATKLVRVQGGGEPEVLGDFSCQFGGASQELVALSGTGPDDVFVAVRDAIFTNACGSVFVAYYDGTEFHRM